MGKKSFFHDTADIIFISVASIKGVSHVTRYGHLTRVESSGQVGLMTTENCFHNLVHVLFSFQHLGDSTKILEDIASGKHPFAAVSFVVLCSYI